MASNEDMNTRIGALDKLHKQISDLNRENGKLQATIGVLNVRGNEAACEIATLRGQLEQERQLRRAVEARLNRLIYGQFDEGTAFNRSLAPLLLCCDGNPNVTVEEAVFGLPAQRGSNCLLVQLLRENYSEDYTRRQITANRIELQSLAVVRRLLASGTAQSLTLEHLLAIRMYTFGNPQLKLYMAVNAPFYDPARTTDSLANQLPFVRLLIRSLRALGRSTRFETGVTVYRGASTENSPYLQQVYDDFINNSDNNNLLPDILLRFPSFTSTSTDRQHSQDKFGDDFVYEMRLNHEVGFCHTLKRLMIILVFVSFSDWS
jgi:hypothetical protein